MLDFSRTLIMGVLNVTPDSFSDGGQFVDVDAALRHIEAMLSDGADIIDIGAESSRPGASPLSVENELGRLEPLLKLLPSRFDCHFSLDTMKSPVAEMGLSHGISIINDISGLGFDPQMLHVLAKSDASLILMHMKGLPDTMQNDPSYGDVVTEVSGFLTEKVSLARDAGVSQIIIDPGIGFGKTVGHNLALLNRLSEFKSLGCPILIGTSRKSFIGHITGDDVGKRLEGSLASAIAAVMNGAQIVRVHDVKSSKKAMMVVDAILKGVA